MCFAKNAIIMCLEWFKYEILSLKSFILGETVFSRLLCQFDALVNNEFIETVFVISFLLFDV